jgi:hypothetical protein
MATNEEAQTPHSAGWLQPLHAAVANPLRGHAERALDAGQQSSVDPTHVTTFGTITAAILRHDSGTIGRIWLVLRAYFAGEGQSGMVSADLLGSALANAFPQYSQRHLRNLLQQGDGIYWQRDAFGRLWLTGAAKVAVRLGITRLQGTRVVIPLGDLTGKLTRMRTALHAAFHASRNHNNPISRSTLRDLTGISERSQREQSRAYGGLIDAQANYSLDKVSDSACDQEHAFRYQKKSFNFVDTNGKQGQPGTTYLAHQLPNSYTGRYRTARHGRKRKINRQLTDNRVMQRARGTGWQQIEPVFYHDGAAVAHAVNRGDGGSLYYRVDSRRTEIGIWITVVC